MTRLRRLVPILAVAGAVVALGPAASEADAAHCARVGNHYIRAENVRTFGGLGCSLARVTIRRYFHEVLETLSIPRGCAYVRRTEGCLIEGFRCFTRGGYAGHPLHGSCRGSPGAVRFREIDVGPR